MHKCIHPINVDANSYIHTFSIPTKEHLHKLVVERPRGVSDHNAHGTARRRISLRAQPVRNRTDSVETDVRSYDPVVSFDH